MDDVFSDSEKAQIGFPQPDGDKTIWFRDKEPVLTRVAGRDKDQRGTVHDQPGQDHVTVLLEDGTLRRVEVGWTIPLNRATVSDLHVFDYGVHVTTLESWAEEVNFLWKPANVIICGDLTIVVHPDETGEVIVATYEAHGEGDLRSLRVYSASDEDAHGWQGFEYLSPRKGDTPTR